MEPLFRDIRFGIKTLMKRPAFTAVALITLALGIGATTAIFSVVNALLVRALPYPAAQQLVILREVGAQGNQMALTQPNFEDIRSNNRSFAAVALGAGSFPLVVTGGREASRARVSIVSSQFFSVMGVSPLAGRAFTPAEDKYGGPIAALVSYGYWQMALGARADFDQVHLNVDGINCNVVGVMPPGFDYPSGTEIWITSNTDPPNTSRTAHNCAVIARLQSGITPAQARADLANLAHQLRQTFGDKTDAVDFAVIPLQTYLTRNVRAGLWIMLVAASLLLLMACANYANLLLAQFTSRAREFTIRSALGASRWRLSRQLVIENALVTLPAAAIGAVLAVLGVRLLLKLDHGTLPRINDVVVDTPVLLVASGLAVLIAMCMGILPGLLAGRLELQPSLKQSGRGQSADMGRKRLRSALVTVQITLTLVLFTGAGLLARSFIKVMQIDPGFRTDRSIAMTMSMASNVTPEQDEQLRQFYVQLLDHIGRLPGVTAVGGINVLPLADRGANGTFLIDGDPKQPGHAQYRVASAGYFAAMNIPLLRGRTFNAEDGVNSPHAALVSRSLAQKYWPNEEPLGQTIQFGNMDTDQHLLHVVGVVGDVRDAALEHEAQPTVYGFSLQRPQWWQVARLALVVRTEVPPETLIPALRTTVSELRADVPVSFQTLDQVFSSSLDDRRFSLVLLGLFAATALLLAISGIYAVISYAVTERTQEIGIRMALGAGAGDVLALVIRNGMASVLVGVAIGIALAFALTRLMSSLLFGVTPTDAMTFAIVSGGLVLVALAACYIPARRATKVDPLVALRHE